MRPLAALTLALSLAACDAVTPEPPARCVALAGDPTPSANAVCANLSRLACGLDRCADAYADYRTRVEPTEFNRLTSCYARARNCDEVDQCERGCGPDGGLVRVGRPGSVDAAAMIHEDAAVDAGTDVPVSMDVLAPQDVVTTDAPDVTADDATDAPAPEDRPDAPAEDLGATDDVPDTNG